MFLGVGVDLGIYNYVRLRGINFCCYDLNIVFVLFLSGYEFNYLLRLV